MTNALDLARVIGGLLDAGAIGDRHGGLVVTVTSRREEGVDVAELVFDRDAERWLATDAVDLARLATRAGIATIADVREVVAVLEIVGVVAPRTPAGDARRERARELADRFARLLPPAVPS